MRTGLPAWLVVLVAPGCGGADGLANGDGGSLGAWGSAEIVAGGLDGCNDVVVDDQRVYWATNDGHIESVPHAGGSPAVLVSDSGSPESLAQDGSHLYWVDAYQGTVLRLPKDGGEVEVLATGQDTGAYVEVTATHVYWSRSSSSDNSVSRVAKDGGNAERVLDDLGAPEGLAVDEAQLFVAENSNGSIVRLDLGTRETTSMVTGMVGANHLAMDDAYVYWTSPGMVRRVAKAGGATETLASGMQYPAYLVLEGGVVYFADTDGNRVMAVSAVGGEIEVVADAQATPHGVAVRDRTVYWCNGDDGTLRRAVPRLP